MSERGHGYQPDAGWDSYPDPDPDPVLICGYCLIRGAVDDGPCVQCFEDRAPLWADYHYAGGPKPTIRPPIAI